MRLTAQISLCLAAVALLVVSSTNAAPKPSLLVKTWQFEIEHEAPRPISIKNLQGDIEWYWYLPYRVTNKTGQDRQLLPEITVTTDQGDVIVAGQNIPARLFKEIQKKERNELLEHPNNMTGKILQGDDFARESVAIWRAFDHDVDKLTIFIGGMSGDTQAIKLPKSKKEVVLTKMRMVQFLTPGTDVHPQDQSVEQVDEEWVMR